MEWSGVDVWRQAESGVGSKDDTKRMSKKQVSGAEYSNRSPRSPAGPVKQGPVMGSGDGIKHGM